MPGAPPVPIPNTAVKPRAANGSRTLGPARVGRCQVYGPGFPKGGPGLFFVDAAALRIANSETAETHRPRRALNTCDIEQTRRGGAFHPPAFCVNRSLRRWQRAAPSALGTRSTLFNAPGRRAIACDDAPARRDRPRNPARKWDARALSGMRPPSRVTDAPELHGRQSFPMMGVEGLPRFLRDAVDFVVTHYL